MSVPWSIANSGIPIMPGMITSGPRIHHSRPYPAPSPRFGRRLGLTTVDTTP